MNTNRLEFRNAVRTHIVEDCIDLEEYNSLEEAFQDISEEFHGYWQGNVARRQPNIQAAFIDWMQGLPSQLNQEFMTYNQLKQLQAWHQQTDEEAEKIAKKHDVAFHYNYQVFKELKYLMAKHGVQL